MKECLRIRGLEGGDDRELAVHVDRGQQAKRQGKDVRPESNAIMILDRVHRKRSWCSLQLLVDGSPLLYNVSIEFYFVNTIW